MKWILLLGITLLTSGCYTELVDYQQVTVPVIAPVVAPVVEPVILDVDNPGPLDVTTTTIDFY